MLGTRTLVPFQVENRFFVLISRMGFRNINFSFFLSVFMCSWHFLVLSEHCQHKCENTIKKTPKKNVGAPEFWCPGTRTLVPPMFLTDWLTWNSKSAKKKFSILTKLMKTQKVSTIPPILESQEDRCPHIFFRGFLDGVLTFMLAVFR